MWMRDRSGSTSNLCLVSVAQRNNEYGARDAPDVIPSRCRSCGWPASTAPTRCCSRPMPTPRSARPPTTANRYANTSTGRVDGDIIWAPAINGAFVLSTRGGDFDLQLGTDVAIGYLAHDAGTVQLYLQETLKFLVYTAEASVALTPSLSGRGTAGDRRSPDRFRRSQQADPSSRALAWKVRRRPTPRAARR
jgi:hypothetical protein